MDCKHIFAVKFNTKLKFDVETEHKAVSVKVDDFRPATCPECKSDEIIKSGIRKTSFGEAQRYKCKSCGHRFTINKGFSRMKNEPKAITLSMDLYFKGISYRKICDHLKQFYSLEVAPTTPMRWVQKYLKILFEYTVMSQFIPHNDTLKNHANSRCGLLTLLALQAKCPF